MATITTSTTVGGAIEDTAQSLLDGLFQEPGEHRNVRKIDRERNAAARAAVELLVGNLRRVYCPDADTRLVDVEIPTWPEDKPRPPWLG